MNVWIPCYILPVDVNSNILEDCMQSGKMTAVEPFSRRQELMKEAKARIEEAQEKPKHYYDIKHSKPCVYDVVAKVLYMQGFQSKNFHLQYNLPPRCPPPVRRLVHNPQSLLARL